MAEQAWILVVYRVPTEPASRRVTIWRDLKRLGVLYLQQCVCILPQLQPAQTELERIIAKIPPLGGEYTRFDIPTMPAAENEKIVAAFRALRDKEYAEIVEECATKFVKEIEFEHFRRNYTFEEAEEIGQDLEKIRRWYTKVIERDWFGAPGRAAVESWIAHCQELLTDFEQTVYRHNGDDAPDQAGALSPIGIVTPQLHILAPGESDEEEHPHEEERG